MAKLHFKYGAMNSGKSDTLIKTAYNYTERGLKVVTVKPSVDTKGEGMIVARGGHQRKADILAAPDMDVRAAILDFQDSLASVALNCALVDESQFLSPEQVSQLFTVAKTDNISVIAFGLKTDFTTKLFDGSRRLIELADNIEKLPTMCLCGAQAEFNCRQQDGINIFEGDTVAIEGTADTTYDSLCGPCYIKSGGTI